jgi:molybdate transport system substrate-binding protein
MHNVGRWRFAHAGKQGGGVLQLKLMLAAAAGLVVALASSVQAAEIKLMSSLGMRVMLTDLIADFERATGHKVTAAYAAPGPIKTRIAEGEPVDVAVLPAPGLDDLIKQGKIVADSKVILARSGMGVGMRVGASKPDISTPNRPQCRPRANDRTWPLRAIATDFIHAA